MRKKKRELPPQLVSTKKMRFSDSMGFNKIQFIKANQRKYKCYNNITRQNLNSISNGRPATAKNKQML